MTPLNMQDPLVQTICHLRRRERELEGEQVNLRTAMAGQRVEQAELLFTARGTARVAQDRLAAAEGIIGQKNGRIAQLEWQLALEIELKNGMMLRMDRLQDQAEVDQNAIRDLHLHVDATEQRIVNIQDQIARERVQANHRYQRIYLEGEKKRLQGQLKSIRGTGFGGGTLAGIVLGGIIGGPLGALLGVYVGVGAGGVTAMCPAKRLVEQLNVVERQLNDLGDIP